MDSELSRLKELLFQSPFQLQAEQQDRIIAFYEAMLQENEVQNLTRLTSAEEFFEGHLLDVLELLNCGCVDFPSADLGSGVGVPGLLAAVIQGNQWILIESEKRKAEYLQKVVDQLGLGSQVAVYPGRAEQFLKDDERARGGLKVQSIVARAVGSVEKIFSWIQHCSTWNNLVLFKGPNWESERSEVLRGKLGRRLKISMEHQYRVGKMGKVRYLVKLERVPRGT